MARPGQPRQRHGQFHQRQQRRRLGRLRVGQRGVACRPSGIAKWNGTTWSPLGSVASTSSATVNNILVRGGNIYVTGIIITAGGMTNVLGLAKWDGSACSAPFGSGLVDGPGTAMAAALAFNRKRFPCRWQFQLDRRQSLHFHRPLD
jgi:hypothetical protein